jgi:hypothetical protein
VVLEWMMLVLALCFFIALPIIAIYYYSKSKRLAEELERVRQEKDVLMNKLLDRD